MPGMASFYDLAGVVRQLVRPAGLVLASKILKYKPIVAIVVVGGRLRWASLM
jgi:hypothetical protein